MLLTQWSRRAAVLALPKQANIAWQTPTHHFGQRVHFGDRQSALHALQTMSPVVYMAIGSIASHAGYGELRVWTAAVESQKQPC